MRLTKDAILGAQDLKTQDVPVPEWGGTVGVRTMTAAERDQFESDSMSGDGVNRKFDTANLRARLCALCMVDEGGARLFEVGDVEALGKKSAAALDRVFTVAQQLNGIGAKAQEDISKNSVAAPSGGSTSV